MILILPLLIAGAFSVANAGEQCCPGLSPCFTDAAPYDHLPLPWCQEDLYLKFYLYTRSNRDNWQEIKRDQIPAEFDGSKKTVFLIHGWIGGEFTGWLSLMKDKILDREEANVIEVRWDSLEIWYPNSASSTQVVGAELAWIAEKLTTEFGNRQSNQWCIGHSLGAQACGFAGKKHKLGKIHGLDPAGPWFEGYSNEAHLWKTDADFVEVIHTNAWAGLILPLGFRSNIGDVDFYPNGGRDQPGCIFDPYENGLEAVPRGDLTPACSHMRVIDLMLESVDKDNCRFASLRKCTDYNNLPGSCSTCPDVLCQVMGYDSHTFSGRGIFYLTTNDEEPYCEI